MNIIIMINNSLTKNVITKFHMSNNPISDQLAPLALFVFNRPEHTQKILNALCNNHLVEQSQLFVFFATVKRK